MSLFEWLGEARNPGPVGTVQRGTPLPATLSGPALYVRGFAGLALLVGGLYFVLMTNHQLVWCALYAVYLVLAYWLRVRPDYSNVGLMGGLMNDPFRRSDNANRRLALLAFLLLPGRFAVASIPDAIARVRGKRTIMLRRTDQ